MKNLTLQVRQATLDRQWWLRLRWYVAGVWNEVCNLMTRDGEAEGRDET
jgi:hypothetical protein